MDDADKIIVEHLQQVGCGFEVETLKDFDAEKTLEAVAKLLKAIIPNFSAPTSVPHNMVAKYNIGMKLADAIISLGFKGELGYQSFLYSNKVELRRIFSFLIEKLPKDEKTSPVQATGFTFRRALASALTVELEKPWLPVYARGNCVKQPFNPVIVTSAEEVVEISDRHILIASILQANASLRAKILRPSHEFAKIVEMIHDKKAILPPLQNESSMLENAQNVVMEPEGPETASTDVLIQDEVHVMEHCSLKLGEELEQADLELEKVNNEMVNAQVALEGLESAIQKERQANKIRVKADELIENHGPEGAVKFCIHYLKTLQTKSKKLAFEWEKHRRPMIEELRRLRQENSAKWSEQRNKRERMERLERERQRMVQEYSLKKELVKQLQAEWNKLSQKDANVTQCSSYLLRIREIVASVARQREEIEKVLIDNRKQQREMNLLSDRLERTFAAAEIFFNRQSCKMEDAKKVHQYIVEIHRDCKNILEAVESNGAIQREIRDLEERIDKEKESKVVENLARITADFNQMKMENDAIETELTKKGIILVHI
ncbi:coiled-coil domain-containing protein 22-like [Tropilaelaps mercedesae]|uniref:Coiled-coil domain-containing protein 22 homolog n=1 Tax=Tropilaelaps mercedesae TaxID=418985 RepID=A0A1V9XIU4_9ACAR|nr:coiled-coil domain-containing protein 22-like [Tropilaelaps mercedesae]